MIRVRQLTKRFGQSHALLAVTLEVNRGECVLLAGPPAGGRSTLLRILATLLPPDSGSVEVDGRDVVKERAAARARSLYADGWLAASDGLRVREYLLLMARCRGQRLAAPEITAALNRAQLDENARVDRLSSAGRARLALTSALAARTDVLLLDEPLRDVEPSARPIFTEWIQERCRAGAAVLTACGDASDCPAPSNRVVALDAGRAVAALRAAVGAR